jgi:NCAIR mutase (PurE)-related protein
VRAYNRRRESFELDQHPKDTALKQLFANSHNDLKDMQVQRACRQRVTEFMWNRSKNSKDVEQEERQQQVSH